MELHCNREDRSEEEDEDQAIMCLQEIEGILLEQIWWIMRLLVIRRRHYYRRVTILKVIMEFTCLEYFIL